jgi:hypothetical protein
MCQRETQTYDSDKDLMNEIGAQSTSNKRSSWTKEKFPTPTMYDCGSDGEFTPAKGLNVASDRRTKF